MSDQLFTVPDLRLAPAPAVGVASHETQEPQTVAAPRDPSDEFFAPQAAPAPAAEESKPFPLPDASPVKKKKGRPATLTGMTAEQLKAHKKELANKRKAEGANMQAASPVEIKSTSKAARKILEDRGIRNPRAIETCAQLAEVAARNLHIPLNGYLLKHGVQATLAKLKGMEYEPPTVEDKWKAHLESPFTELELFAIWDFSTSWRNQPITPFRPCGSPLTSQEWMKLRHVAMTDLYSFGKDIIGLDLHDEPHGMWCRDLFVQKKYLLPEKYDWEDVKVAMASQSDIHQRMLCSARSSYKSSVNIIDLLQWVLVFNGELRTFIISSTAPLSAGFVRKFRAYFTVKNANEPTLFNQLFPEHMLQADDSAPAKNFFSPVRRLDETIQPTLSSTSLDSQGLAGERCDLFVAEDIAEISNSNNPDMREKTLEKFDMLRELLEPFGYLQIVCTPFASGKGTEEDPGDVYAVTLRREARHVKDGGDPRLVTVICPGWTVKAGVKKKPYDPSLTADEVELLFPSRLTFKNLMAKLRENLTTDRTAKVFRQQTLCEWTPDDDETWRVTFERADLDERVRHRGYFDAHAIMGQKILGMDRAYSISKYADNSVLLLASKQLVKQKDQTFRPALVFTDCRSDRWRESDLIRNICEMIEKHKPHIFVAEMDKNWQSIWDAVRHWCTGKGIPAPRFMWKQIVTTDRAAARRAKMMEAAVADGRIWFVDDDWTEGVLKEFESYDGVRKSTKARKDDAVCAASLVHQECGVKYVEEIKPEDLREIRERAETEYADAARKEQHRRHFGGDGYQIAKKAQEAAQQPPIDVAYEAQKQRANWPRGGAFATLPSNLRGFNKR